MKSVGKAFLAIAILFTGLYAQNLPDYWTASKNVHGSPGADDIASAIEHTRIALSESFELEQNYPNPFNPSTSIRFSVPFVSLMTVKIYYILGEELETIAQGRFEPAEYIVHWNAEDRSAGLYFCRLEAEGVHITKKMILIK